VARVGQGLEIFFSSKLAEIWGVDELAAAVVPPAHLVERKPGGEGVDGLECSVGVVERTVAGCVAVGLE
jgi:hypothetical protein